MEHPVIKPARHVKPGDIVEDCGGEAHEVTDVEEVDGELIIYAADDLAIITAPDHQLVLPGMPPPPPPPAVEARPARRTRTARTKDTSDFQSSSTKQGRVFDEQCRILIEHAGFECSPRPFAVDQLGIEIDAEIKGPNGTLLWAEFKGSWLGTRPGASRTDTARKAIANAFLAWSDEENGWPPVILLTSHLPRPGSRGETMLRLALKVGALRAVVNVYEPGAEERLRALDPPI